MQSSDSQQQSSDTDTDDFHSALEAFKTDSVPEFFDKQHSLVTSRTNAATNSLESAQFEEEMFQLKQEMQCIARQVKKNYEQIQAKEEQNKELRELALRLEMTVRHLSDASAQPCCVEDCVLY